MTRRASEVLEECADLMNKKGKAYNNIPQAEYYPRGQHDIYCMMWQKMKRMQSLLENPNDNAFEGLNDSARDLINYTSFFIEFSEGKMDGMTQKQLDNIIGKQDETE
ncbi:MAG: hypothetical protein N0C84_01315 [Candidatus Thiodiazotropha taylori]|uniref:Nucleotide modification associated domain-containing protein n=1 Tax=Candidatus Thiodiazotropha taylori TaxID=2792791 RepID=A0A9E4K8B6_9GAMM|nr:hypothetical protein [Candidatus Thiodiazotropha taylori]MCW4255086.1 hypothetical protein [Candidatus Thiodiazotropha taylori]